MGRLLLSPPQGMVYIQPRAAASGALDIPAPPEHNSAQRPSLTPPPNCSADVQKGVSHLILISPPAQKPFLTSPSYCWADMLQGG